MTEITADDLGAVDDPHAVVVVLDAGFGAHDALQRVDCEQLDDAAYEPGLLGELAHRTGFGVLAEIDATTGQRPRTGPLGDRAEPAHEQPSGVVEAHVVGRDALDPRELAHSSSGSVEVGVALLAERGHPLDEIG